MTSVKESIKIVYQKLVELGYRPVVIGTYALILQGWVPPSFIDETKDVDLYVDDPMVVFDDRVEDALVSVGLVVGRSEVGGLYVSAEKPIEIIYPIFNFYLPKKLLSFIIRLEGMEVLEGHAVLVAKALGSDIEYLARYVAETGVDINVQRLFDLLRDIKEYIEPGVYRVAEDRLKRFARSLAQYAGSVSG